MGEVINFQQFKEKKQIDQIEFVSPKYERYCPSCNAPTIMTREGAREVHKFDPNNMEAYLQMRKVLVKIVDFFKNSDDGVTDDALTEAFGEGMQDFLEELAEERNND